MDAKVTSAVKSAGNLNRLDKIWGSTLYHKDDLPFRSDASDLPDVFTPFRNKVESKSEPREPVPPPAKGALPVPSDMTEAFAFEPTVADLPFANEDERAIAAAGAHLSLIHI